MEKERFEEIVENLFRIVPLVGKKVINHNINKELDITSQHFHVLLNLKEKGALTVTQLANILDICKSNITPVIQKLIDKGYVERNTDENDRRYIFIKLTTEGREFLTKHKQLTIQALKNKMLDFSEEDLEKLDNALQDFRNVISKIK